jgi:hypothetical protein
VVEEVQSVWRQVLVVLAAVVLEIKIVLMQQQEL